MNAQQDYEKFKATFRQVCESYGGTFSQEDTIGNGAAFRVPTCYGQLRVSIHAYDGFGSMRGYGHYVGIYMQFRNYTGPTELPFHGDWNRYSNKWNITITGQKLQAVQDAALCELKMRLLTLSVHGTKARQRRMEKAEPVSVAA